MSISKKCGIGQTGGNIKVYIIQLESWYVLLYMRGSISQKDKNLEKSRKRGVVCLTKSAQPEPILVCFKFSIFTLAYGFTYSYWYRSDRWPTHPWALANIHDKCVNRVKHFLAFKHTHLRFFVHAEGILTVFKWSYLSIYTLLLAYTLFKVACIISAFFFRPVFDPSSEKNECGGRT